MRFTVTLCSCRRMCGVNGNDIHRIPARGTTQRVLPPLGPLEPVVPLAGHPTDGSPARRWTPGSHQPVHGRTPCRVQPLAGHLSCHRGR